MTIVWAQCPPIDLSSVPGNAIAESFENMTVNQPPGPCYDTLWLPANSSARDTNGWYVRNHPTDLTGVGSFVGSKALRISYLDYNDPPDTATVLYGPPLQLVPLRKYRVANLWWWRDDPDQFGFQFPTHIYYFYWHLTNGTDTIPIRRDTLGYDALFQNGLYSEPSNLQTTFRLNSSSSGPWRLGIEVKVEQDDVFHPSFFFIDSVAIAQVPNDLAYILNANYSGTGSTSITVISNGNSSTENDTLLITLPCDMPLNNVTGFSVELTPGATLDPSSIDGDYDNQTRSRSFTITSEDGTVTRTLIVIVTPRYTPNITISAGGANGADLSVNNPSANHSYTWQFSSNNTSWTDITGATGATYTATQNGYYRVKVDSAGCEGYSNVIHITTLLSQYGQAGQIRVYPNPVEDVVYVEMPVAIKGVSLYGPDGRLVRRWDFPASSHQVRLQVGDLPAGLYMLRVEGTNGVSHYRIRKAE